MTRFQLRLRRYVGGIFAVASLAVACGDDGATGASSSSASGAGGAAPDGCAAAASCEDCAARQECGFCYQTGQCQSGDANGPSSGSCATWRPFDDFGASCFGPIECDPRPPAASGPPCVGGEGCYIISSTEGTRCLPAGVKAPGEACAIGDFSNVCQPGFVCDLSGSTGACHQVCTVGDDSTCPAGSQCAIYLDVLHGPYGACR